MTLLKAVPTVALAVFVEVMTGPFGTARVNAWVAVPKALVAVNVWGKVPLTVDAGVPARVAVPLAPGVKVMPLGRVPVRVMVACG